MKEPMTLVKPADIPAAGPTPLDNLIPLFRVCTQMERLCTDSDGIGLSAVQVGIPWKLYIILNRRTDTYEYFIDCEYEGIGEKQTSLEGCLSLRDSNGLRRFEVQRYPSVKVTGHKLTIDDSGLKIIPVDKKFDGIEAVVHQHEIDHHRGVLISDIGKEVELL